VEKGYDTDVVEKIADRFYSKHSLSIPVDIEAILSRYVQIDEYPLPDGVDAIYISEENSKPYVALREGIIQSRRRFTLAHELGHIIIPWHTGACFCSVDHFYMVTQSEYNMLEQEADLFASCILMPKSCVLNIVNSCNPFDADKIVNNIIDTMNVSNMAACYRLQQVLPAGYCFQIENHITATKFAVNSQKLAPSELTLPNGVADRTWLHTSIDSVSRFSCTSMDMTVIKFKYINSVIDAVDARFSKIGNKKYVENLLKVALSGESISYAHMVSLLSNYLPNDFVIYIYYRRTGGSTFIHPRNSIIYAPMERNGYSRDTLNWYEQRSKRRGSITINLIVAQWWQLQTEFDKPELQDETRESPEILRKLINEYGVSGKERISIFGRINGTIGSLNNKITQLTQKMFFDTLKQKFCYDDSLLWLVNNPEFDVFLAKKVGELYGKLKQ
jgi:hypothetical protein